MKRILILLIVLTEGLNGSCQFLTRSVRIAVSYPITTGDNFMNSNLLGGKGYSGIIDAEIEYDLFKAGSTAGGIDFNISILKLKESEITASGYIPGIFVQQEFSVGKMSLIPQAGAGYSRWRYKGPDLEIEDQYGNIIHIENKKASNGYNFQGSLRIASRNGRPVNWFLQFKYEFTRLEKPSGGELNSNFNRNFSILYPGAGISWQF
ncbi:MAG TPA: hypothetical protein VK179_12300 [Bacteroidales bacterium]|nr:hypothetical protein [Bacteroidales bacterium]